MRRGQRSELCENRGGRPGLCVPNTDGPMVSVGVRQHLKKKKKKKKKKKREQSSGAV